jgi:hypothetical protein
MDTGRMEMSGMKALDEGESYSQEVMRGEWNPVLPALQEAAEELAAAALRRHGMPPHVAEMDVEDFLRQMYAAQG